MSKRAIKIIDKEIEFLITVHGDEGRAIKKLREIRTALLEEVGGDVTETFPFEEDSGDVHYGVRPTCRYAVTQEHEKCYKCGTKLIWPNNKEEKNK